MTIKQFIETAIEGGWEPTDLMGLKVIIHKPNGELDDFQLYNRRHKYLLDPEVWKSVGKAVMKYHKCLGCGNTDWRDLPSGHSEICNKCGVVDDARTFSFAYYKMTDMVQKLVQGSTLEEYIATL